MRHMIKYCRSSFDANRICHHSVTNSPVLVAYLSQNYKCDKFFQQATGLYNYRIFATLESNSSKDSVSF
jgi:hypothetical protein